MKTGVAWGVTCGRGSAESGMEGSWGLLCLSAVPAAVVGMSSVGAVLGPVFSCQLGHGPSLPAQLLSDCAGTAEECRFSLFVCRCYCLCCIPKCA